MAGGADGRGRSPARTISCLAALPLIPSDESLARRAVGAADWPVVTIAILAFNRREPLRVNLEKVFGANDYPHEKLDVVVVDNASDDGTGEMVAAEFPQVRLIRLEENLGAPALNRAFESARGEWILVLDDDCYVDGDAIKRAVAAGEANDAGLISFRVRSSFDPGFFFTAGYPTGLLAFIGCAFMLRTESVRRAGGFDPNIFIWGNEVELTVRILDEGFRHLHLPEVVAVHMKEPPKPGFIERRHELNFQHWAYGATKLLRPLDAARVLGRLTLTTLIDLKAIGPEIGRFTFPAIARGAVAGIKARRPVRPEVSAAYRDNFISYANPLALMRGPVERLRGLGTTADERLERFRAGRRAFFPAGPGLLEL